MSQNTILSIFGAWLAAFALLALAAFWAVGYAVGRLALG